MLEASFKLASRLQVAPPFWGARGTHPWCHSALGSLRFFLARDPPCFTRLSARFRAPPAVLPSREFFFRSDEQFGIMVWVRWRRIYVPRLQRPGIIHFSPGFMALPSCGLVLRSPLNVRSSLLRFNRDETRSRRCEKNKKDAARPSARDLFNLITVGLAKVYTFRMEIAFVASFASQLSFIFPSSSVARSCSANLRFPSGI